MDVYNGYQTHYQHTPDMSIHDLVECDMKELDMNYNDPAFDGSNIIYPDAFHQHIKSHQLTVATAHERCHSSRAQYREPIT